VLEFPVVFVSERLESRWQELVEHPECPPISSFPSNRFLVLEDIWVVSTYIRLRRAGLDVQIASVPRDGAINVVCAPRSLLRCPPRAGVVVAIRADRARQTWGDLNLVQNPLNIRGPFDWLIDHWPQPNILPRRRDRGHRVERVGILSPTSSIAPQLRDPGFALELERRGFELVVRTDGATWNDYSDLDVQVAYRTGPAALLRSKPATKIIQSWIARCPAVTGVEPCFRVMGRPGVDYLEAASARDVIKCLEALRDHPEQYQAIVENGARRAPLHDERAVLGQWVAFLRGPASTLMRSVSARRPGPLARWTTAAKVIGSVMRHRMLLTRLQLHQRCAGSLGAIRGWFSPVGG